MITRDYKGWLIKTYGGHITIRRFVASRGSESFWRFRLREAKADIDQYEKTGSLNHLGNLYRKSLY